MSNPIKFVLRTWQVVAKACSPLRDESAPALSLTALEDRILYDASPLAGLVTDVDKSINAIEDIDGLIHDFFVDDASGHDVSFDAHLSADDMSDQQSFEPARELLVIDESVDDIEALFSDILLNSHSQTTFDIVRINDDSSGIEQISEALNSGEKYDAVHIVSHGSEAALQLGSLNLSADNIGDHTVELSGWASGLTLDADILLYGCDVAGSADGEFFVEQLSSLTGADVAASDDLTGNALLGGDWEFEFSAGTVEAEVAFSKGMQSAYLSTFATAFVDVLEDVVNGDTSSIDALNANDGGDGISLREAVIAANNTFDEPDIIRLRSGVHELTMQGNGDAAEDATLGDLQVKGLVEIIGAADGKTVIDANGLNDRVFHVTGQDNTFRNFKIQGGEASDTDGGGGILAAGGSTVNIDSVVFFDNTATVGGGLRSGAATLTVIDSSFTNNEATEDGGAFALTSGTATIQNSTASGNSADNRGGAVYVSSVGAQTTHQFINLTLSGNSALQGGGLFSNGGTTNVEHATITDNAATDTGGGIQRNSGDLQISNSIIAGNRAIAGSIEIAGDIDSGGKNIIGDNPGDSNGGGGFNNDLLNQTGLKLGDLADNGGQVQTHELLEDSVGIDGTGVSSIGQTDARGHLVADSVRDTGAFERGATPPPSEHSLPASSIWVSSLTSHSGSSAPGLSAWDDVDVIEIGDPNLVLESGDGSAGTTNGTFGEAIDFELFAGTAADTDAIHYVQNSITVGGVELNPGDVLFSGFTFTTYSSENSVGANAGDVLVFQPSTAGDYSSGTFTNVVDVSTLGLPQITGFSLVEADVTVGDANLQRGDFVFLDSTNQIHHYDQSAGTSSVLVDGNDLGIDGEVAGVHLVTAETTIGGQVIDAGRLLISVDTDDAIAFGNNISVAQSDVIALDVTQTGAGTTTSYGLNPVRRKRRRA